MPKQQVSVADERDKYGEALAVAAHELRTPIAAVSGYAQLLLRQLRAGTTIDQSAVEAALLRIDAQACHMEALLERLLDRGFTAGLDMPRRERADLRQLVLDTVEQASAAAPGRQIRVDAKHEVRAIVDVLGMQQVLGNLLDNAFKFSPVDTTVEVSLTPGPGPRAQIAVRDHGVGVPIEARERIFDRFFQAEPRQCSRGIGLGLYLCRSLVDQHGGTLSAEFPCDGGARFVIALPTSVTGANSCVSLVRR